jgi:hypothetical protein
MAFTLFFRYFYSRKVYRSVCGELSQCTDYELQEMCLNRRDIDDVAEEAAARAWRERPGPVARLAPSSFDATDVVESWRQWRRPSHSR